MFERNLGPVVLQVEHRAPGSEGGPTLRVRRAGDGRELLRFDCFAAGRPLAPGSRRPRRDQRARTRRRRPRVDPRRAAPRPRRLRRARRRAGARRRRGGARRRPSPRRSARCAIRPYDFDAVRSRAAAPEPRREVDAVPRRRAAALGGRHGLRRRRADPARAAVARRPLGPRLPDPPRAHRPARDLRRARARALRLATWSRGGSRSCTDVVQGVYVGLQQLSEPGEGVVVQTPIYAPFLRAVKRDRAAARRRTRSCSGPRGYEIDLDGLPPRGAGRAHSAALPSRTTRRAACSAAPSSRRMAEAGARARPPSW